MAVFAERKPVSRARPGYLQPRQSQSNPGRGEGEEMGSGRAAASQRKLEGLQGWGVSLFPSGPVGLLLKAGV